MVDAGGRRTLDADGLTVTPGFVDIHTHFDGQATWDPHLTPSCWHGVTTAILGQLRRRLRARAPERSSALGRADGGRRGHPRHRVVRRHQVGLGDLPRVPRRAGARAPRDRRRRDGSARGGARLRDGRARPRRRDRRATSTRSAASSPRRSTRARSGSRPGARPATATSTGSPCPAPTPRRPSSPTLLRAMHDVGHGVFQIVPAGIGGEGQRPDRRHGRGARLDDRSRRRDRRSDHVPRHAGRSRSRRLAAVDHRGARRERPGRATCARRWRSRCFGVLMGLQSRLNPFQYSAAYSTVAHLPLSERVRRHARTRSCAPRSSPKRRRRPIPWPTPRPARARRTFKRLFPLGDPLEYEPRARRERRRDRRAYRARIRGP